MLKSPIMIWDDLRVHASGSIYHSDPKLVAALIGLLDTVRTVLNSLVLTPPSADNLLGFLKSYDDHLIRITYSERGGSYRIAKG